MLAFSKKVAGDSVVILAPQDELPDMTAFENSDTMFGLDVETTAIEKKNGKGPFDKNAQLRLVQLGTYDQAWVFRMDVPQHRDYVAAFLSRPDKTFVTATNYDPLWIRTRLGVDFGERVFDSYITACLLEPGERNDHGLKGLSQRYIDDGLVEGEAAMYARFKELAPRLPQLNKDGTPKLKKDGEPAMRQMSGESLTAWGFTNIPVDDSAYVVYAGLDAVYVRRLWDILQRKLDSLAALDKREQWLQRRATDWQIKGIRLDVDFTKRFLAEVEGEYNEAVERLWDLFGFTPGSPRVKTWLAERGVEFTKLTDTGQPSLDKEVIPGLALKYANTEAGPALRDLEIKSSLSNKLMNLKKYLACVDENNVAHPKFNILAAETGRMSINYPAMQTLGKPDEDVPGSARLRQCWVARPGQVFISADLDQIEVILAAGYSGDPALLRVVHEGISLHDMTAEGVFGVGFTPKQRQIAKTLNFACQFGAGPKTVSEQTGVPMAQAKKWVAAYRKTYQRLQDFSREVGENPFVINDWGRITPRDDTKTYRSLNTLIQGSGRDVLWDAIMRAYVYGVGEFICLPVHDELLLSVPEDRVDECLEKLSRAMNMEFRGIPIKAKAELVGPRWAGDKESK